MIYNPTFGRCVLDARQPFAPSRSGDYHALDDRVPAPPQAYKTHDQLAHVPPIHSAV